MAGAKLAKTEGAEMQIMVDGYLIRKGKSNFFRFILSIFVSMALISCNKNDAAEVTTVFPDTKPDCATSAVPDRFLVHWKDGRLTVVSSQNRQDFIENFLLNHFREIEFAEHDQIVRIPRSPSPKMKTNMTLPSNSLELWGQKMVSAPQVWDLDVHGQGIRVAVIDTGVDIHHPQLEANIYTNPHEIANGLDDDGNGLVDDIHGYDFYNERGEVSDGAGHGTHIAGIIAADPAEGPIHGLAPRSEIIPLDFMNDDGAGQISDAIRAMNYAVQQGARIINASWGSPVSSDGTGDLSCSVSFLQSVAQLEAKGILFVSAAGNSGADLESEPEYPAAFALTNQITVGASSTRDYTAGFSNFSRKLVHLMAPGVDILSTLPDERVGYASGTSMATPFVSAAAALLWSARPHATVEQVRSAILESVDRGPFAVVTKGRLNIAKALSELVRMLPDETR